MYGIMTQDGGRVLCHSTLGWYALKRWDRNGNLVMRDSAIEIDNLMQEFMVAAHRYDLSVFEFTREQEEDLVIRKLRDY